MSSPAKSYTVPELKELCKKYKIPVSGKVKRELEEALVAAGEDIPITGKPRSPKVAAPPNPDNAPSSEKSPTASVTRSPAAAAAAAAATPAPVIPTQPPVEYVKIIEIYDDTEVTSLILRSDVPDLEKLKDQIRLPIEEREREENADFDYVELLIKKRKRFTKESALDLAPHEIVVFSAVVYMY